MNLDQNLKTILRERADSVAAAPVIPHSTVRRARVRKTMMAGGALAVVAVVAVTGAVSLRSAIQSDAAPAPPAQKRNQEIDQMRNGRIVHSQSAALWQGGSPVPRPGAKPYFEWEAFDQETGLFLYALDPEHVYTVVDQDGLVAEFPCDSETTTADDLTTWATTCAGWLTLGPGPDEVSAPSTSLVDPSVEEAGPKFVRIMAFDGTVRDTLDVSVAVPEGQLFSDLAWSPDERHLAISTAPYDCDPTTSRCEAHVWIFDRDGGEPQLVFTERTSKNLIEGKYENHPHFGHLAWSPDGRTLSLLVEYWFREYPSRPMWPRLVALRLRPDQPARADTLHVYGRTELERGNIPDRRTFGYFIAEGVAYAWSPDGTRIAVNSSNGVVEISADDGTVLTRHPADEFPLLARNPGVKSFLGSLAWLPKQ